MKQFTLLLELCQKTQKPLQSRDKEKSNPGKMKIRGTGGVVKYDGLLKEIFQTNVLSIRFIVPFICYNPTTTRK